MQESRRRGREVRSVASLGTGFGLNNDFNNLYYEELEEVRLQRKKKVIDIKGTNNSMLTYFF